MPNEAVDIVLIEDNPDDIELTLRAFKKYNLTNKIIVLRDGEDALDYIFSRGKYEGHSKHERPKLILLDLKLPKIDGLEVLRELKGDESTKMVPVVVLTSSKEERDLVESYRLGVNSYIKKPVDFAEFMECIKNLGLYWVILNEIPESWN
ncbi:response regulator receiver protein [Dissulfuribacter thermophilus]|uniref:Response regulator receiver protein n=1 Tax=Dissulfuribacter thermophilus TaxID=1156395 RepID=A0A1B9F9H6_9BACT|nr:response regulator [Dissulfuribacter thermophilus]OCC16569.1 response regulator receiver protein [Dissulfuribacter thermophilus]